MNPISNVYCLMPNKLWNRNFTLLTFSNFFMFSGYYSLSQHFQFIFPQNCIPRKVWLGLCLLHIL